MSRSRKILAAALSPVAFALLLTACGGGSGNPEASGGPSPTPTPAPTPPVAAPEPEPTPQPTPDPELLAGEELAKAMANGSLPLPSEHGIASGRIEIAAGAYEDRNGLRFSCTGTVACIVSVDGEQAQVVAGDVRLARLTPALTPPVAMPEPEPSSPTPDPALWPAWMVMDVARAHSLVGGSALDWGRERAEEEIRRRVSGNNRQFGSGVQGSSETSTTWVKYSADGNAGQGDDYREAPGFHARQIFNFPAEERIFLEYQPVMEKNGIPIVQARHYGCCHSEQPLPYQQSVFVGLLDYSDFWVQERVGEFSVGEDRSNRFPVHSAEYRYRIPSSGIVSHTGPGIEATWRGTLIGIGHNPAFPDIYRQRIVGDVEMTSAISSEGPSLFGGDVVDLSVVFSDIKNVNTGAGVSLSKESWNMTSSGSSWAYNSLTADTVLWPYPDSSPSNSMVVHFPGPNVAEAGGVFVTHEALGAFGAKKQE